MSVGPTGEKRPADPIACAVTVGRIATEQEPLPAVKRGAKRNPLSTERRSEIARNAAKARWSA